MNEDKEKNGWKAIGEDKAIADKYRQEKMFASFLVRPATKKYNTYHRSWD